MPDWGFRTVDEYYDSCSCIDSFKHVSVPLLCLQTLNDAVVPRSLVFSVAPRAVVNPNVTFAILESGGHNLLTEKFVLGPSSSFQSRVVQEFLSAVHRHSNE
eukprot:GHVT01002254.1.p1 GENE.GHVT01002254.1~~GHVT01002254.1.p1  ORF type:complete len:102 (+),score=3.84 GHVT01002254.1:245-550(+)